MFNFLDSRLTPNVRTGCPATDGYEVSNLVSDTERLRSRGFLAFPAMRPPVELDFELICPVNLHHVCVWNSVHAQKSSGFEIYLGTGDGEYRLGGKAFPEGSGFAMYVRKYCSEKKPALPDNFSLCYFKASEHRLLRCVDKVKIRITRTTGSVPCVGRVEIWGEAAVSCTDRTRQTIAYLMKPRSPAPSAADDPGMPSTSGGPVASGAAELDIPADFLDDISCEVMSIPMTLPCGRTVDQTTLERHARGDSAWGRAPSDPYTGLPFSATHRPVLNAALKNRIEQFLLAHGDRLEARRASRTVGRRAQPLPEYAVACRCKRLGAGLEGDGLRSGPSDDLDLAIENTLIRYNITRFSTLDADVASHAAAACASCRAADALYRILGCGHLVCRPCLLAADDCTCKQCNKAFKKTDVIKHHSQ